MTPCLGPYPMTVDQMKDWAEKVTQLDPVECAVALQALAAPRPIKPVGLK